MEKKLKKEPYCPRDTLTDLILVFGQQKPEGVIEGDFANTTTPCVTPDEEGNTVVSIEEEFVEFKFNKKGEFLGINNILKT
jgi:hypothetical protein